MTAILSLDGGGLRGLITALILQRIEEARSGFLDHFDLITGTSTGALLALALARGMTPSEISRIYETRASEIFRDSLLDNVRDLGKSVGAQYQNKGLIRVLGDVFGEGTLGDLRKRVAICAFDLDNELPDPKQRSWAPKIFHNYPGPDSDAAMSQAKVALYSASAPTYFPSADGYIDGGVFANNPSMVGLCQVLDSRNPSSEQARLEDVVLFSAGTGANPAYIKGKRHDWGLFQWIHPLMDILIDGVSGVADFQCRQLLGDRYFRLQPSIAGHGRIGLDAVRKLGRMRRIGETWPIEDALAWIDSHF